MLPKQNDFVACIAEGKIMLLTRAEVEAAIKRWDSLSIKSRLDIIHNGMAVRDEVVF